MMAALPAKMETMKKQYSIKPNNILSVKQRARTVKCSMKPQKSNPPRAKQNRANNFHPKFD